MPLVKKVFPYEPYMLCKTYGKNYTTLITLLRKPMNIVTPYALTVYAMLNMCKHSIHKYIYTYVPVLTIIIFTSSQLCCRMDREY